MIGVFQYPLDKDFFTFLNLPYKHIQKSEDIENDFNGLFIDWVSVEDKDYRFQIEVLERYITKKIPVVIFDRHFSLTEKEVEWLKRFHVYLLEPALNSGRHDFFYMPVWLSGISVYDSNVIKRTYDLLYLDYEMKYNAFDKWYLEYKKFNENKRVAYFTKVGIDSHRKQLYKNAGLEKMSPNYDNAHFTIAIGGKREYEIGYLNPIYYNLAMLKGCIPLLPFEHKYFHCMFKGLVVQNISDVDYFVDVRSFRDVKAEIINDIFSNIKNYYPEFTMEHAVDMIRQCYE